MGFWRRKRILEAECFQVDIDEQRAERRKSLALLVARFAGSVHSLQNAASILEDGQGMVLGQKLDGLLNTLRTQLTLQEKEKSGRVDLAVIQLLDMLEKSTMVLSLGTAELEGSVLKDPQKAYETYQRLDRTVEKLSLFLAGLNRVLQLNDEVEARVAEEVILQAGGSPATLPANESYRIDS